MSADIVCLIIGIIGLTLFLTMGGR
jgi:hypothetical protein